MSTATVDAGAARGHVKPGYLLAGVTLTAAAITTAATMHTGVWSVLLWAIFPDLALLTGVGRGQEPGRLLPRAVPIYNLLHRPLIPVAMIAGVGARWLGTYWLVASLSWFAHISFDRGCGYGLRTRDGWQRDG